jgi:hypothetical protein
MLKDVGVWIQPRPSPGSRLNCLLFSQSSNVLDFYIPMIVRKAIEWRERKQLDSEVGLDFTCSNAPEPIGQCKASVPEADTVGELLSTSSRRGFLSTV